MAVVRVMRKLQMVGKNEQCSLGGLWAKFHQIWGECRAPPQEVNDQCFSVTSVAYRLYVVCYTV